jgi:hypothetical protein
VFAYCFCAVRVRNGFDTVAHGAVLLQVLRAESPQDLLDWMGAVSEIIV